MCSVGSTSLPKLPPLPVSAQPCSCCSEMCFPTIHQPNERSHGFIAASLGALIALWLMGLHRYQLQMSCSECLQGRSAKGIVMDLGLLPGWGGLQSSACRGAGAERGWAWCTGRHRQRCCSGETPLSLGGCIKVRKYSARKGMLLI